MNKMNGPRSDASRRLRGVRTPAARSRGGVASDPGPSAIPGPGSRPRNRFFHMFPNRFLFLVATLLLCGACERSAQENALLPEPVAVREYPGSFKIHTPLSLWIDAPDSVARPLADYLLSTPIECVREARKRHAAKNYLHLVLSKGDSLPASAEGYVLAIRPAGITVRSHGEAGLFYGLQTLLQLHAQYGDRIPAQKITDYPRFAWRGLHLDVSRNFFDAEFVKKQLRMMASLKLNRLHWHLTDGAGWRLAIDAYPRLTEEAAWRVGKTWQEWRRGGSRYARRGDPEASGGYYTKEQVRDVLALADSLHITVVPEIEMPGHSEEVLAVYPELSCSGEPGTSGEFCLGNEQTYVFLERVFSEVLELFPSEFIHIGGDEASSRAWMACPKCRALMEREGLKTPAELQAYAVHRIGRFLEAHGRRLVGWDEILDGSIPADAVVMSWRGEEGGRRAATAGHDVVMTPGSYCYFDGYQDNPMTQPQAFTGYLPLSKVYSYDPAPEQMAGRDRVLGVQANLWTEYIPTPEQAEYMLYPRAFALAEVAWSPQKSRDYDEFRTRALIYTERAREAGYNAFDLESEEGERPESLEPVEHLAVGCPVSYATPWHRSYPADGVATLTDGQRGPWSYGERWQGFLNSDVDVTVDLGAVKPIREVAADFMQWYSAWVWLPARVEIEVSADGETFRRLGVIGNDYPQEEERPEYRTFAWKGSDEARYVRYHAVSNGRAGGWLFTDEIIIR